MTEGISFRGTSIVVETGVASAIMEIVEARKIFWLRLPHPRRWMRDAYLPFVAGQVRVWDLGNGQAVVKPLGLLSELWRRLLDMEPSPKDVLRLAGEIVSEIRELGIVGVCGTGGSLPGLRYWDAEQTLPFQFATDSPAERYLRRAEKLGLPRPIVAEVGLMAEDILRLASACGVQGIDASGDDQGVLFRAASEAAQILRGNAERGNLLLVLRRNPSAEAITGFVIAIPVLVPHQGTGNQVWIHPDVHVLLCVDEDEDRYFVDLVRVKSIAPDLRSGSAVLEPSIPAGSLHAPNWVHNPEQSVKHSGLYGVVALAGVSATDGVGPLHTVAYRIAATLSVAGYVEEAVRVSSALLRVLETLFDARDRTVSSLSGTGPLGQASQLLLPYAEHLLNMLNLERMDDLATAIEQLSDDLIKDSDEDARNNGRILGEAVPILRRVTGEIEAQTGHDPVCRVEDMARLYGPGKDLANISDLEMLASWELFAPLSGRMDRIVRPMINFSGWARPKGGRVRLRYGPAEGSDVPAIGTLKGAAPRHYGSIIAQAAFRGDPILPDLPKGALDKILFTDILVSGEVFLPSNKRNREEALRAGLQIALSVSATPHIKEDMRHDSGDREVILVAGVRLEPGERVRAVTVGFDRKGSFVSPRVAFLGPEAKEPSNWALFRIGLGTKEVDGSRWHRWHLLATVTDKYYGVSASGTSYVRAEAYKLISLCATPWIKGDPGDMSGAEIRDRDDRRRWLPIRIDVVVSLAESGGSKYLAPRVLALSPSAQLLMALQMGILRRVLGDTPYELDHLRTALGLQPKREASRSGVRPLPGAGMADRVIRSVREVVRKAVEPALLIRTDLAVPTARRIIIFGDAVSTGFHSSGVAGILPDENLWRFTSLVDQLVLQIYDPSAVWYPRKRKIRQNRLIVFDPTDREAWSDMLASGISEWYRFARETAALMMVPSKFGSGPRSYVQERWVAIGDGDFLVPSARVGGSAETAYLFGLEEVEQERSQLVDLDRTVDGSEDPDMVFRPVLEDLLKHGFDFLRGTDGGLVEISRVLEGAVTLERLHELGVAHKVRDMSVSHDYIRQTVQFWAVSRQKPAGAKVVVLDGMIKSFATVLPHRVIAEVGEDLVEVSALFSGTSLRQNHAWGVILAGEARARGIDPELIFDEYRRVLAERNPATPAERAEAETAATKAAFAKARELGLNFQPSPIYVDRGNGLEQVGHAWVGRVRFAIVDSTIVRDDEPEEVGINATTLLQGELRGVGYAESFVRGLEDAQRMVAAYLGALNLEYTSSSGDIDVLIPREVAEEVLESTISIEDIVGGPEGS